MFRSISMWGVAVALTVGLASSAFAAGKGSNFGSSGRSSFGGSSTKMASPVKVANPGISKNDIQSMPLNKIVGNTGVVGHKGSPVVQHDKIRTMPGKIDPGFSKGPKFDPTCHKVHHSCWVGGHFGCFDSHYHFCPVRLVRCHQEFVVCGGELVLIGESMNLPAIAVRIELAGASLDAQILTREPGKMVVRMPQVSLTGPTLANVRLILPNGQLTDAQTVQVFPAR